MERLKRQAEITPVAKLEEEYAPSVASGISYPNKYIDPRYRLQKILELDQQNVP